MTDTARLRVLHVGKFYPPYPGGIESHVQTLCNELRDHVDVRVLVSNAGPATVMEIVNGVPVTRVGTKLTMSSAPISPGIISRMRSDSADIVHLHHPNPVAVMAFLLSGHTGKLVVTYHSDIVRQRVLGALFRPFLDRSLSRADAIIATSPNYLATSLILQPHRECCSVIPLGVPTEQFERDCDNDVASLRSRFGERIILSVGRLIYYKGFDVLLRAMKEVRGSLIIVGNGPLEANLKRMSRELGVADRVYFLGHVDSIIPYYKAADVFVLASVARSEAFGIVQLEAMACGRPVINTAVDSGVPFVSRHGETGLTVPPDDAKALAEAITTLLDDVDLRAKYGDAARRRVASEFTSRVMGKRTLDLYQSLVGKASVKHTRTR